MKIVNQCFLIIETQRYFCTTYHNFDSPYQWFQIKPKEGFERLDIELILN